MFIQKCDYSSLRTCMCIVFSPNQPVAIIQPTNCSSRRMDNRSQNIDIISWVKIQYTRDEQGSNELHNIDVVNC
jgi:hypothetical protein